MTPLAWLPPRVAKEAGALAGPWLLCLISIAVGGLLGGGLAYTGAWIAYSLGAVALGALSMGHEYNGRSLTLLLSQPVHRARLLLDKFGVLVPMVVVLGSFAWFMLVAGVPPDTLQHAAGMSSLQGHEYSLLIVPVLCALLIAPWMTIVCRNSLAGMAFTVALPLLLWFAAEMSAIVGRGVLLAATPEATHLKFRVLLAGMWTAGTIGGVFTWLAFGRLEALDGGTSFSLTVFSRPRETRQRLARVNRPRPVWQLVKKELRLQQLTFAVSGLYLVVAVALLIAGRMLPSFPAAALFVATIIHCFAVALVPGAMASAEERQLGTAEWQTLLPLSTRTQWIIKAAMAVSLTLALGLGVPFLLSLYEPSIGVELRNLFSTPVVLLMLAIATLSVYVSSLSSTSLRALIVSLPVAFAALVLTNSVGSLLTGYHRVFIVASPVGYFIPRYRSALHNEFNAWEMFLLGLLMDVIFLVMFSGAIGLLLIFGRTNHHTAERTHYGRTGRQLACIAVFLVAMTAAGNVVRGRFGEAADESQRLFNERIRSRVESLRQLTSSPNATSPR